MFLRWVYLTWICKKKKKKIRERKAKLLLSLRFQNVNKRNFLYTLGSSPLVFFLNQLRLSILSDDGVDGIGDNGEGKENGCSCDMVF